MFYNALKLCTKKIKDIEIFCWNYREVFILLVEMTSNFQKDDEGSVWHLWCFVLGLFCLGEILERESVVKHLM